MKQDITEVKETNAEKLNARRNKALALRLEGLTDRAIADKLKISAHTLWGAWHTNLDVRPEQDWKELKGRAVVDENSNSRQS